MYTAIRLAKAIGFKRLIRNVGFGNVEARVRVGGSGSDDPPLRGVSQQKTLSVFSSSQRSSPESQIDAHSMSLHSAKKKASRSAARYRDRLPDPNARASRQSQNTLTAQDGVAKPPDPAPTSR
jgi:hypothetical protein